MVSVYLLWLAGVVLAAAANGGKRAAPGKLRLRLRWAQGMVSVYPLWLAVSWGRRFVRMGTDGYGGLWVRGGKPS